MNDRRRPLPDAAALLGGSKLPAVGTTVFTVMSELARQHQAINLGQGFPDFDCAPALQNAVADALRAGHNQYAPMAGVLALREAVSDKIAALHGHRYDPESEITITAGGTQALMSAVLALVRPGDEVIVIEPAYDSYVPAIELAGGRPVYVPLDPADDYAVDWDRVRDAIGPRTRLLMLNSPHNPTGRVLGADDLAALEAIVDESGLFIVADEVYEHIVFDGREHRSLARSPLLAAVTVLVSSFGKTFHATGWKIGYACAPAPLSAELRKVHQFMVFSVSTPVQHGIARYLDDPQPYLGVPAFYQTKRDRFLAGLARTRFRALPCQGTYFVVADYSEISAQPEADFARRLVTRYGVASIPVSAFYHAPFERRVLRFCFAKRDSTLDDAVARLASV
jgi:methionine aminotransferase